ncbi:MAG: hypothetical protein ACKVX9_24610, partial [Blastocatellia bacterium]
ERATRAIELTPYDPFLPYFECVLGLCHLVDENYRDGAAATRRALRSSPSFSAALRVLTICLALDGQRDAAQAAARRLIAVEPQFSVTNFKRRFPSLYPQMLEKFGDALGSAGIPP